LSWSHHIIQVIVVHWHSYGSNKTLIYLTAQKAATECIFFELDTMWALNS